jgi:3D (Asp-Asp-Asp) domain-containing protein/peptidoglycan hydrolase CwlO-like protein
MRGRIPPAAVVGGAVLTAVLALSSPSAIGAGPSGAGSKVSDLRARTSVLQEQSHHALLDLYSLETQLADARGRVASLHSEAVHVRAEQALVRRQMRVAQDALTVSQRHLAEQIRALYEQGDTDPLAVILGSTSLSDALATIDDLSRAARQSRRAVAATRATRSSLRRLAARLAAQRDRLDALESQARESAAALARAHAERAAFLARLHSQQRLNAAAISSLESAARAAQARSATLTAESATATSVAAVGVPLDTAGAPDAPSAPPVAPTSGERTLTVLATGYAIRGHTATGLPTGPGIVAVDPSVIPLGTHMTIPGYGEGVAADTGGAVRGAVIDLWFASLAQALAWGRRTVTITLH